MVGRGQAECTAPVSRKPPAPALQLPPVVADHEAMQGCWACGVLATSGRRGLREVFRAWGSGHRCSRGLGSAVVFLMALVWAGPQPRTLPPTCPCSLSVSVLPLHPRAPPGESEPLLTCLSRPGQVRAGA